MRQTTITEDTNIEGNKRIFVRNSEGFSATLIYGNEIADITYHHPGEANDYSIWNGHPDDALTEMLSHFLEF